MRAGVCAVLCAAAAFVCEGAAAQTGAAARGVSLPGFPHDAGASFLGTRHRFDTGRWAFTVDGIVASSDGHAPAPGGRASAGFTPVEGLSVLGRYGAYGGGGADLFGGTEAGGEVLVTRPTLEAWLSWTLIHPTGANPGRSVGRTGAGVRWRPGAARLGVTVLGSTFSDSTSIRYDTVLTVAGYPFTSHRTRAAAVGLRYLDVEADANLPVGPLDLGMAVGGRQGDAGVADEAWARARASVPLPLRGLRLELSAGVRPTIPERALPRARFLSVGLRWQPSSGPAKVTDSPEGLARASHRQQASPSLEAADDDDGDADGGDVRTLMLRNVAAASVEVMGDFTDWEPRRLAPVGPATWSTRVALRPGTYRYLLRLDGGDWGVPAGLPSAPSDFGGDTGILVVAPRKPRDPT